MRKINITLLAAAMALSLALPGCGNKTKEEASFNLYYLNSDLDRLITEEYTPADEDADAMVKEILEEEMTDPGRKGTETLLPEDVKIRSCEIEDNVLRIDFSQSYAKVDTTREVLARGGIVRSVLQAEGIDTVVFTVGGEDLTDSFGNAIGPMTAESFVENAGKTINNYTNITMTLYYTDQTGMLLLPEVRNVYYSTSEPAERAVVEALIAGPTETGHYPTLPAGTNIISVLPQDDVCYVNFDASVNEGTLNVADKIPIYSIVNSLAATCGTKKVQFTIDGSGDVMFRNSMDLSDTFKKDNSLVRE